jgi:hypothetical protein
MDEKVPKKLGSNFEAVVMELIERDKRIELKNGLINHEKVSPPLYEAVRQRLLELAGLEIRHDSERNRGEIHLKVGDAERLVQVVRNDAGAIEVAVAVDVVKPADVNLVAATSCPNIIIKIIDTIIVMFCCGGHCSRGAYSIPCEPGGVFTA